MNNKTTLIEQLAKNWTTVVHIGKRKTEEQLVWLDLRAVIFDKLVKIACLPVSSLISISLFYLLEDAADVEEYRKDYSYSIGYYVISNLVGLVVIISNKDVDMLAIIKMAVKMLLTSLVVFFLLGYDYLINEFSVNIVFYTIAFCVFSGLAAVLFLINGESNKIKGIAGVIFFSLMVSFCLFEKHCPGYARNLNDELCLIVNTNYMNLVLWGFLYSFVLLYCTYNILRNKKFTYFLFVFLYYFMLIWVC